MKSLVTLCLVATILLTTFGSVAAQSDFTPTFTESPCEITLPAGEVDGETVICGTVEVPELHADPTGKTIRLSVAILKGHGTATDPLVMFTGGPGGNVFNLLLPMSGATGTPVRDSRDIVFMSERGSIGASPELTCPEIGEALQGHLGEPLEEVQAVQLEAYEQCRERWVAEGVNLNAYTNPERAADVPMVMAALGYESYNLWGVSGGGIMAQYVLREHPEGVRTVMTDSGAFPTVYIGTVLSTLYTNISRAYRLLFETCAADAACNEAYPDLETNFWNAIDTLNAEPAPITITDPVSGETAEFMLTGEVVISLVSNLFGNVASLPATMSDIIDGDYSYIATLVPSFYMNDGTYADALYESVFCSETNQYTEADFSTEGAYPQVVSGLQPTVKHAIDLCQLWNVNPVAEGEVLVSDVPILIMEGNYDTNKPPELGAVVAENFSTSYLVDFDSTAHGTFGACAIQLMGEFMNDPSQAPDTSCVPTSVTFILENATLTFSDYTFEEIGVSTIIPDGWTAIDAATHVNPIGDTFLVVTALPGDDIDAAATSFAEVVGLPALTKLVEMPIGENTWWLYTVSDAGRSSMVALAAHDGSVYVAGIQSPDADFEAITDSVLRPVVEAITFDN